jgi:hypothetical protein
MRYWWVNQNQTYTRELRGGFMKPGSSAPRSSPAISWKTGLISACLLERRPR